MKAKTYVCLLSGGLDSTTLLYWLRERTPADHIVGLGIHYGQRHARELQAARSIASDLGVAFEEADISGVSRLLAGSSQTSAEIPVPEGHYADENMKKTVVPNRNMLMLSIAAALAVSLEYDAVAYAAHAGDHAIYPDCRPEFAGLAELTIQAGNWHQVQLVSPFIEKTKTDIAAEAARLGVPIGKTWSCYKGQEKHCGKCGTCVERIEAIRDAGLVDPTEYE